MHGPAERNEFGNYGERVFREEYDRLIATFVRRFGDIDIAHEAAGEALVVALEKWPRQEQRGEGGL